MFPIFSSLQRAVLLSLGGLVLPGILVAGTATSTPAVQQSGTMLVAEAAAVAGPATRLTDQEIRQVVKNLQSLPPGEAALRARIIRAANGEIGTREHGDNCQKYSGTCGSQWCGVFIHWVWHKAGATKLPTLTPPKGKPTHSAWWATFWGQWGAKHDRFKPNDPDMPTPGDAIVYGARGADGHIGMVLRVHADGTLTTSEGNYGDMVSRRHIDPKTAVGGARNKHVHGYVSPVRING